MEQVGLPETEQATSALPVRLRGLFFVVAGMVLVPVVLGVAWLFLLAWNWVFGGGGPFIYGVALVPLALSLKGWLELLTGIPFDHFAQRFEAASISTKVLLSVLIVLSVIVFIVLVGALFIWVNNAGWL